MNTDKPEPDDGSSSKPGDIIYLGSDSFQQPIYGVTDPTDSAINYTTIGGGGGAVGSSGYPPWVTPAGGSGNRLTYDSVTKSWQPDKPPAPSQGGRPVPALRFEIDGWEYSFPSLELARKLREKLIGLTLEGDL